MTFTAADARHMARALQLAQRGLYTTDPNPRVGCVIVRDERVVGEGFHRKAGEAHAEVEALKQAGELARGATVYVTLEPCCHHGRTPPCTEALLASGATRIVAAMADPNPKVSGRGATRLRERGVTVDIGLMETQSRELNPGFIQRMTNTRPWIRLKMAASLDGRTALANGESKWITGPAARADAQHWRARSSAILTGIGTVLADDPSLTVRDIDSDRQPLRVVLDSKLRMPGKAKMLREQGKTLIVTTRSDSRSMETLRTAGAEVTTIAANGDHVDLKATLQHLVEREINEVLVEAGPVLSGALLREQLIDEMILYYSPSLMGHAERGMFALPALAQLDERIGLTLLDTRVVGNDLRILAKPNY